MRRWHSHFRQAVVIDRSSGERLGQVQRFLIDPQARAVVSLLLAEPAHGRPGLVAPLGLVASFGDVIMLDGRPPLIDAEQAARLPGWGLDPGYPLGVPVLSSGGGRVGRVGDYRFNFQNGRIEEVLVRERFWHDLWNGSRRVPARGVQVFGPDALILVDNVQPLRPEAP